MVDAEFERADIIIFGRIAGQSAVK